MRLTSVGILLLIAAPPAPLASQEEDAIPRKVSWHTKGESTEDTALREVREETGLTARIVDSLGGITYWYYLPCQNVKCRKTVTFYLMEFVTGDTANHDHEVDQAAWFTFDEALSKVSFKADGQIIEKAKEKLEDACAQAAR